MDKILYASCAAGIILLIAAIVMTVKFRYTDTGIVCIRETWMTAVIGGMLIALGFWLSGLKLMDATVAGTDETSYWFVAGFSLLCHLLGDFALLYTMVKRVVLYEDCVESCSVFGKCSTLYWADIVKVEKPLTRRAFKLTDKDGNIINVSGDNKACKQFVDFAKTKVKAASGSNLLHQVEHKLKGGL